MPRIVQHMSVLQAACRPAVPQANTRIANIKPGRQTGSHAVQASASDPARVSWCESTLVLGLLSAGLMWLALPPLDLGWLAWFAPIGWLLLIRRYDLSGWRPYVVLYGVGWVYFGTLFYWVMLPHLLAILGWIALTTYLAFYLPLFVGVSRFAVHRVQVPLLIVAPVMWTGMEFYRGHLLTGFLMATLGHTQHDWLAIIQCSDLFGAYGVSFLVMFVAAALAMVIPYAGNRATLWPMLPAVALTLAAFLYGTHRLNSPPGPFGPRVALIQGSIDTQFDRDPQETQRLIKDEYEGLTRQALRDPGEIKMIVWPESMSTIPMIETDDGSWLPASLIADWQIVEASEALRLEQAKQLPLAVHQLKKYAKQQLSQLLQNLVHFRGRTKPQPFALVLGTDREHYGAGKVDRFNSSIMLDSAGKIAGRYDKMHLVMFGEYVPFGEWFPSLYALTPLTGGLTSGEAATVYEIDDCRFAPNICYETVLPHVIRRQLLDLDRRRQTPDVLLSQTNDGWFWGSSALDMHLICGIFRAVEFRTPLLIAANTGLSASIDGRGRVRQLGPRRESKVLFVEPQLEPLQSFYLSIGDLLGGGCGLIVAVVSMWAIYAARRSDNLP